MNRLGFRQADELLSQIEIAGPSPVLDLSAIEFMEPYGIIKVGLFLRYHRSEERKVKVIYPQSERVIAYLSRVKFFERFGVPEPAQPVGFANVGRWTSLNDIIEIDADPTIPEEVERGLSELIRSNDPGLPVSAICEVIVELVDNFVRHSKRGRGVLTAQYYGKTEKVAIGVGDWGIGFKENLARVPQYAFLKDKSDADAILHAFKPQVTSKQEGGMGLFNSQEAVQNVGGILRVSSGSGFMVLAGGKMYHGELRSRLPGVQFDLEFKARR